MGAPAHARPQAPQWAALLRVSVSQPLLATPSQLPKLTPHDATVHATSTHAGTPDDTVQTAPQRPQCATLTRRSASQPSTGSPLQSAKPGAHANAQRPAAHAAEALGAPGHALPQSPQLAPAVRRCRSRRR